jgi:outer membrane protein OmpA-like peptidoglycan-associated protein
MHWSVVGLGITCAIALGALVFGRPASTSQEEEQTWRQRELAFLVSAHERVRAELEHQPNAVESLRSEERAIVYSIATVAKSMPPESLPANVKLLLTPIEPAKDNTAPSPVRVIPSAVAVGSPVVIAALDGAEGPAPRSASGAATAPQPVVASINEDPIRPAAVDKNPPNQRPRAELNTPRSQAQLEEALRAEKTDRGLRIRLPADALFGMTREATVTAADPSLSGVVKLIAAMRPREVVVVGHSDASTSADADLALTKKRARAVSAWLKAHGLNDEPHLVVQGYGGTLPVAPNENADGSDNPDGRQQNRRIEILLRRH